MKKVKLFLVGAITMMGFFAEAQVLKADDQLAIQNQIARWNQLQDDANIEEFMSLWTADAKFTNPFGSFSGKANIQSFVEGYVAGFAKGKRHNSTNVFVKGNGTSASVVEDMVMLEVNEIPTIAATVRLNGELVKEAGQWKFKEVTLVIDPGFGKLQAKTAGQK